MEVVQGHIYRVVELIFEMLAFLVLLSAFFQHVLLSL